LVYFLKFDLTDEKPWLPQKVTNINVLLEVRNKIKNQKYYFPFFVYIKIIQTLLLPINSSENIDACQRQIKRYSKKKRKT